ncbi:AMP-binding protein, partial [Alphaproteobacteria bacterium]|nr:AMP-binding protein [Alphaproteobacteria bacterium]
SVSAGEALPENIGKKWYELTSTHILDGIGSTEMLHIFLSNKIDDLEYGTTGIAVPGYELKLLDENNNIIYNDEIGELLVKGESSADGYWNMRNKSRKTFEGEWTRTGDKYIRNKKGRYVYCGRTDDLEEFKKHLENKGIKYSDWGETAVAGWKQIFFYDPDGNIIEVHEKETL